jgi:hypothetical protein
MGEGELELCLPSPIFGRGAGGEGKDLSKIDWDAPDSGSPLPVIKLRKLNNKKHDRG